MKKNENYPKYVQAMRLMDEGKVPYAVARELHMGVVLARYVGYASWPHFCDDLHFTGQVESEEFAGDAVSTSSLSTGDQIVLAWLPDRILTIEYLGGNRFEVLESINSSLRPGDSFECLQFQYGRPLYLDRFRRSGSSREARYVVGEEHGLTSINVL